jgi:tRNA-splicing ligase RtcB (3'-phosphate/5'-hydroxy nucleic acid ligase)
MPILTTFKDEDAAPVKIWTDEVEESAMVQLRGTARLPFIHKHVAVMPDVHWGMGSTVGSVIPTIKAIVPAAVGVDIGCGMVAHKLNIRPDQLPDSLIDIRGALEFAIPHGRTDNGGKNDRGAWGERAPARVDDAWALLAADERLAYVLEKHPKIGKNEMQAARQLATLGTGNHFVELCLDKEDGVWLMLHSGSRGFGNRIGTYFIEQAKRLMDVWSIKLPDPNLAYIPDECELFEPYWRALSWAQDYARINRELMMEAATRALGAVLELPVVARDYAVNCHHNYVAFENHFGKNVYVTRKGAVRAREGDMGIIPGSMGARSFIVRGKGNPESFCSCSHGAGRKMSRGQAKKQFTVADLAAQTAGIECRKDADVIDEIPGAYKSIETVMRNQSDLVDIVAELRQIVCVKG